MTLSGAQKAAGSPVGVANAPVSPKGELASIAARILMKVLYAARMARFDLLRPASFVAQRITKWCPFCDKALHRLMCYINSTIDVTMTGWCGDDPSELRLALLCDADFAGCTKTARSTSGICLVLVGPNSFCPSRRSASDKRVSPTPLWSRSSFLQILASASKVCQPSPTDNHPFEERSSLYSVRTTKRALGLSRQVETRRCATLGAPTE